MCFIFEKHCLPSWHPVCWHVLLSHVSSFPCSFIMRNIGKSPKFVTVVNPATFAGRQKYSLVVSKVVFSSLQGTKVLSVL